MGYDARCCNASAKQISTSKTVYSYCFGKGFVQLLCVYGVGSKQPNRLDQALTPAYVAQADFILACYPCKSGKLIRLKGWMLCGEKLLVLKVNCCYYAPFSSSCRVLKHMLGYYCFAQLWLVLSDSGRL
ncbi:uncharacterized protein [Elaeis guineensis]|uniref:uncharacterized protein isoform X4 n=1 Tax=Elaeis guineensis var. tenera TaxID=51953 RepID=UPI003C6D3DAF